MTKIDIRPKWREVKPSGHYVYIHFRLTDLTPFYVGMGKENRAWQHGSDKRSEWWMRTANKHGVKMVICQEGLSRPEALLLEMWLIAKLRHEGHNLVNLTLGGDGCCGMPCSDEAKALISEANGVPVSSSDGLSFPSASEAARWLQENGHPKASNSTISQCARGVIGSAHGRTWWVTGEEPKEYTSRYDRTSATNGRVVIRSDGMRFRSTQQAAVHCQSEGYPLAHQVNIASAARGKRNSAYGYAWWYEGEPEKEFVDSREIMSKKFSYTVIRCDGMVYQGTKKACEALQLEGIKAWQSCVAAACRHGTPAYGYTWRYAEPE